MELLDKIGNFSSKTKIDVLRIFKYLGISEKIIDEAVPKLVINLKNYLNRESRLIIRALSSQRINFQHENTIPAEKIDHILSYFKQPSMNNRVEEQILFIFRRLPDISSCVKFFAEFISEYNKFKLKRIFGFLGWSFCV